MDENARIDMAHQFFEQVHPTGSRGLFALLAIREAPDKAQFHHDPFLAAFSAIQWDSSEPKGVYFGVGSLGERPTSGRGTEKDIIASRACFVDLDGKDFLTKSWEASSPEERDVSIQRCYEALEKVPRPSKIVFSGRGLQAYWLLERQETNLEKIKQLNRTLAARTGGDSCFDLARVLRVPGTHNRKDPKNPILCTVIQ